MNIYFIGIGGIGVSSLAQYYLEKGHNIYGSDAFDSELIHSLKQKGMNIVTGEQKAENLPKDLDLVIYSPAIQNNNEELKEARKRNIKTLSYPQTLGELSKEYFTIAITGTHGKSTTTAMTALILEEAGLDPTVIIGTKMKEFGTNFKIGKSKYLVIEACEYEDSFLSYHPDIGVILNMEADHLDYFKTFENIKKSFKQFENQSKQTIFSEKIKNEKELDIIKNNIQIPGEFNALNALTAMYIAREIGVNDEISLKAISKFNGTWRRMDIDNSFKYMIINDYAHHPTEVEGTLKAIGEKYKNKNIHCIYQPHQYERTNFFFEDFKNLFIQLKEEKVKKYLEKQVQKNYSEK
jgi:UDP-N-acetylmuramate--alanine ligase